jgi:GT2 family glycosyltransferase
MKKVAIIILNWNREKDTLDCLYSIRKLTIKDVFLSIFVVDNNSQDNSVPNIKKQFPEVQITKNAQNLGFTEGNNVGIRQVLENQADYVIILNNDTIVDKDFVNNLLCILESENRIGIVGPKIYFAKGFEFHKNRYKDEEKGKVIWYAGGLIDGNNIICHHRGVDEVDHRQYDRSEETDFVSGCCMAVKKEVFEKIGLFDKKYFMYLEDVDLCQRAKRAGWKITYEPKAVIWHKNAASSGKPGSKVHNYYLARNRLLFGMRYASVRTKLALIKESFFLLIRNLPGERKGIIDFYLRRFGNGGI